MSTQEILGCIGIVLVLTGGVWGIIKMLLVRDRKSVDDQAKEMARVNEEATRVLWSRLDDLRGQMVQVQIEQGVLRERVNSMPDHDSLNDKLQAMEEKLERKLDGLVKQIQDAVSTATAKFRCPHDSINS